MQAEAGFTSRHNLVQHGPTISVQIGFDPSYQPSGPLPNLGTSPRPALVDTGAVATCIDSSLAADLQLPIIGRKTISGVLGAGSVYVHLSSPDLHSRLGFCCLWSSQWCPSRCWWTTPCCHTRKRFPAILHHDVRRLYGYRDN